MSSRGQRGGVTIEALLEFLLVLIILPPLVACALQAILAMLSIVVPWVALVLIVVIVVSGLAVALSARGRNRDFLAADGDLPALPPIDRPKAPRRRREDDDLR